jgi:hypothetical protein
MRVRYRVADMKPTGGRVAKLHALLCEKLAGYYRVADRNPLAGAYANRLYRNEGAKRRRLTDC